MPVKEYTVETRFSMLLGSELRTYCDDFVTKYNRVYREMWHTMTSSDYKTCYPKESSYVTEICNKYGLLKRTVNSIRYDIKGRMKSYMELKKTEVKQLDIKISVKSAKIQKLMDTINTYKPLVKNNAATIRQLQKYRDSKKSLYYQKNKLNNMCQARQKLKKQITDRVYSMGFGGKRMFKTQYLLEENRYRTHEKWYNDYVKARDKNIFYLGSSDESCGNQMFQMTYNADMDDFSIKIRKENAYCKDKADKYIVVEHIQFKHMHEELVAICESYNDKKALSPLTFRFHRRGTHWYLQVMFRIEVKQYETTSKYGTIGLDYNDGFIELSETDEAGNLIGQKHYPLMNHGTGNKAKSEIEQTISQIVNHAYRKGKTIVIEDLSFKKKKSQTDKHDRNKKYNRMIHLFDYGRYIKTIENTCHRKKVELIKVNPYMTSQIGKKKYTGKKKLNIHQAASYVIARKGQGFIDKYNSTKKAA